MSTRRWASITRHRHGLARAHTRRGLLSGAIAALALAVAACGNGDRRRPATDSEQVRLVYRITPAQPAAVGVRVAKLLRERMKAAGVQDASVSVNGDRVLISAVGTRSRYAIEELTAVGHVAIYDWQANVIGPRGSAAPRDPAVTGGPGAGRDGSTTRYAAIRRASARAPDTTTTPTFWLLDDARRRVLKGPATSRAQLGRPPRARDTRIVTVNTPTALVRAERGAAGWYALNNTPAITHTAIHAAKSATDPRTDEQLVRIEYTPDGQRAFTHLTRNLARRGHALHATGTPAEQANQHFAIVIDAQIATVPRIDFQTEPNGIDGRDGGLISGGLNAQRAATLAAILDTGPLPATLKPITP